MVPHFFYFEMQRAKQYEIFSDMFLFPFFVTRLSKTGLEKQTHFRTCSALVYINMVLLNPWTVKLTTKSIDSSTVYVLRGGFSYLGCVLAHRLLFF